MCNKVVPEERFMLKYFLYRHKTQKVCDRAVDICVLA